MQTFKPTRVEIICSHCVQSTGKWRIVPVGWKLNCNNRPEPYSTPEQEKLFSEFEHKVLTEHYKTCPQYLTANMK